MRDDFFTQLEHQLRSGPATTPQFRPERSAKRWRRPAVLVALLLLAAGTAVAGDRLLPIGSEVPVRPQGGKAEPERYGPRVVVATGRTPVYGRWQVLASRSSAGFCEAIQFLDDAAPSGSVAEGCGRARVPSANAVLPVPGSAKPQETVIYGRVPEDAARVRVTVPALGTESVKVSNGPSSIPGDWYLVAFSGVPRPGTARIVAVDEQGRQVGGTTRMEVSLHPTYPNPVARLVGSSRLVVSSSGHVQVPLRCPRSSSTRGKCIGTAVIRIHNRLPRCEGSAGARRARCGWQYFRLAPGTKRRVIRVRVGPSVVQAIRRAGSLNARVRIAGAPTEVALVSR